MTSRRSIYFFGFLIILFALSAAYYLQIHDGVTPCPLCIFQRICFALVGLVFLLGALFKVKRFGHLVIVSLGMFFSILGLTFAGRQVWLQHTPSVSAGDCTASLDYMLQVLPITEVVKRVFIGGAECSQISWQFLRLSLAEWSLIAFVALIGVLLFQAFRDEAEAY